MSEAERVDFVSIQAQRISTMMGDRSAKLDENAVQSIKAYVDSLRFSERCIKGHGSGKFKRCL
jgi:hypothetical protein